MRLATATTAVWTTSGDAV